MHLQRLANFVSASRTRATSARMTSGEQAAMKRALDAMTGGGYEEHRQISSLLSAEVTSIRCRPGSCFHDPGVAACANRSNRSRSRVMRDLRSQDNPRRNHAGLLFRRGKHGIIEQVLITLGGQRHAVWPVKLSIRHGAS